MTGLSLTVDQLKASLDAGDDLMLLDVREPAEWERSRIEGATLIPMNSIPDRLAEVPRDRPVACMCHYGGRSAKVQAFLLQQGYQNVFNVTGGIDAWSQIIDPAVPRY